MKKIFLLENVNIATMCRHIDAPFGAIKNGAMLVEDGRIQWLGTATERVSRNIDYGEVIDGGGCWVLPGFIDCHTHLIYGGHRANEFEMRMAGLSYEAISKTGGGIQHTVNATRKESFAILQHNAQKRLLRLLSEGVTTVEIKSGYGLDCANELKMLEVIRALDQELPQTLLATCLAAHAVPEEYKANPDAYIDWLVNDFLPLVSEQKLASHCDVFCETVGFTYQQSKRVLECAKSLGFAIKGHVEQLSNLGGSQLVAGLNGLSVDHVEYLDEKGIDCLKQNKTTPVLLPSAFYFLRETQKPPVKALRNAGVEFAIATDLNPGSSPCGSLLLAMNMAAVLFGCTVEECLAGITRVAAKALGLEEERGQLREGMVADFSLWDIDAPSELVYGMNLYSPSAVYISGKKVNG
jgi:imidazolonepropionase